MVRLRVCVDYIRYADPNTFQFLNGTIKSHLITVSVEKTYLFQFLNGTIKSGNE